MEQNDIVKDFLVESYENLDQLDRDLLALEQEPSSHATMSSVFRTIHTIKGTCGFLGFGKLEHIAHAGENLLSRLRDGELFLNADRTTGLLHLVDAIRAVLASIENSGQEGEEDFEQLVQTLVALQQDQGISTSLPATINPTAEPTAARVASHEPIEAPAPAPVIASTPVVDAEPPVAAPNTNAAAKTEAAPTTDNKASVSDSTIRVDVGLVDKLMNLVGELVLARNQIMQFSTRQQDATLTSTTQRLNLITTELQEGVMKTRMQPINTIWSKFPRVVRDLATLVNKQIRLEMEGQETELDRTIIEAIKDPLTHLVRNSVDHGIEPSDVRVATGKAAEGRLLLRAYHEGGQVNIEIIDDGGGVNAERVKAKALERGLIAADQAARMSEHEIVNLIFLPGFSTAAKVSNISGRGVGMDVVKTNIEKIGGTVDVQSRAGQGTTIKLKIPLTLAIIPALIVTCGGDRFAIPQVSLQELVGLDSAEAKNAIEMIHGAPVYRLRGKLLPLVYLNRELRLEALAESGNLNIVVLHADDRQFGLIVDGIRNTEEIVVKPLSNLLKSLSIFAGATIMGDGHVALILDVPGLAKQAHVVTEHHDRATNEQHERTHAVSDELQSLLLFRIGQGGQMAIPLSKVARLEEVHNSKIERTGSREVVQYRGQIMPLVRLSSIFPDTTAGVYETENTQENTHVVVYQEQGHNVGLVVDRILDIVQQSLRITAEAERPGIMCSAVIQDRVTEIVDLETLLRDQFPTDRDAVLRA